MGNGEYRDEKAFIIFVLVVNILGLLLSLVKPIGVVFNFVEVAPYSSLFDIVLASTRIVIIPIVHVYFIGNYLIRYKKFKKREKNEHRRS